MQTKRVQWLSDLRVIATISVVLLHVASPILYKFGEINNSNWWIGNIFDGIVRFSVPVFVMITGALLLPQEIELKTFFTKRFKRVLIPFLFWSFIYILYSFIESIWKGQHYAIWEIIDITVFKLNNGASFHFWYIYMILGLYLFIPILGKWIKNCTEKEILYFLIIWFLTIIINSNFINISFPKINLLYFTGYIGYLILGYYLSFKSFENTKYIKAISLFLFLTGVFITIFGTYFFSKQNNVFNNSFYDYLTPNVLLSSIGIFLYIKSNKKEEKRSFINRFIDKYSYGIYLVHVLIIDLLGKVGLHYWFWNINPIIMIPLTTIICSVISVIVIFLTNKLPFGKYISG